MLISRCKIAAALLLGLAFLATAVGLPAESKKTEAKKDEPKKNDVRVIEEIAGIKPVILEGKSKKLHIKLIAGGARVECGNLDVEEIEIDTITSVPQITLKLPAKARLKKLTITTIGGGAKLDCSSLDVSTLEINTITGISTAVLQAAGDISINVIDGDPKLNITGCRNLNVMNITGVARPVMQATGDIAITTITGKAQVTIPQCRNLSAEVNNLSGLTARYSGEAKVKDFSQGFAKIDLKKIEAKK